MATDADKTYKTTVVWNKTTRTGTVFKGGTPIEVARNRIEPTSGRENLNGCTVSFKQADIKETTKKIMNPVTGLRIDTPYFYLEKAVLVPTGRQAV